LVFYSFIIGRFVNWSPTASYCSFLFKILSAGKSKWTFWSDSESDILTALLLLVFIWKLVLSLMLLLISHFFLMPRPCLKKCIYNTIT